MADSNLTASELQHQIALIRTAKGLGDTAIPVLTALKRYVRGVLLEYDAITSIKVRDLVTKQISDYINEHLGDWVGDLQDTLLGMVDDEVEFRETLVTAAGGTAKPPIESVVAAIKNKPLVLNDQAITWDEYLSDYPKAQANRIKGLIKGAWANKSTMTTRDLVSAINGTSTVKGAIDTSQRSAYMMAQDLTRQLSSQTRAVFGKANKGVIIGEQVLATLDSKTSEYCRNADGKKYYYKKDGYDFPRPAYHPFCRTTMTYITRSGVDTDANRPLVVDGKAKQVSAKMTWFEAAKQYPSLAEESLGETRAYLLKNMSADEFKKAAYNRLGEAMTLQEMRNSNKKVKELLEKREEA